jgi:hypothetical protein
MGVLLVMGGHFPPLTQLRTGLVQIDTYTEEKLVRRGRISRAKWEVACAGRLETAGERLLSGADDGIRTRDSHLGKGAASDHGCSPPFMLAGQGAVNAFAASHESGRTVANRGD